jgi:hypothetical protein
MLPCVGVALSYPLPHPISFERAHSSSSFESLTDNPKIVLNFFLGGELTNSRLNLCLGVGDFYKSSIDGTNMWVKVML